MMIQQKEDLLDSYLEKDPEQNDYLMVESKDTNEIKFYSRFLNAN